MNLEVEAKFQIDDLAAVKARLLALGGKITKARIYEKNTVYDDAAESLKNSQRLIRLRQDEKIKLTFKGPAPAEVERLTEAKVREEIELEVADFDKMEQIIGRLGYSPAVVYEKYRETIQVGEVEAVLDELPYGNFVELEGSESAIKALAADCKIAWETRLNTNYLSLLRQVITTYQFEFSDLTFANFEGRPVDWGKVLQA